MSRALVLLCLSLASLGGACTDPLDRRSGTEEWGEPPKPHRWIGHALSHESRAEAEELDEFEQDQRYHARERADFAADRSDEIEARQVLKRAAAHPRKLEPEAREKRPPPWVKEDKDDKPRPGTAKKADAPGKAHPVAKPKPSLADPAVEQELHRLEGQTRETLDGAKQAQPGADEAPASTDSP